MLGGLFGTLGGVTSLLRATNQTVNDVAETVSPGSTSGFTTTGNLINDNDGATGDLITGLETGEVTGAFAAVYSDIIGPGSVVHNLGSGYGLGIEGLLANTLNTADGFIGTADGLLDGALGDAGGLLG